MGKSCPQLGRRALGYQVVRHRKDSARRPYSVSPSDDASKTTPSFRSSDGSPWTSRSPQSFMNKRDQSHGDSPAPCYLSADRFRLGPGIGTRYCPDSGLKRQLFGRVLETHPYVKAPRAPAAEADCLEMAKANARS